MGLDGVLDALAHVDQLGAVVDLDLQARPTAKVIVPGWTMWDCEDGEDLDDRKTEIEGRI